MNQRFLPEITLAEVNAVAKGFMPDRNRLVAISAPEADKPTLPNDVKLAGVISATDAERPDGVRGHREQSTAARDVPPRLVGCRQRSTETFGITEWTLSNGVKVVLKPTTYKQDEIVFRAISPGGTSLASDAEYIAGRDCRRRRRPGRARSFQPDRSRQGARRHDASVRADIGDTEEGLRGGAARKDLETMFQLIYLTFTAPRADPVAFDVLTEQLKCTLANREAQPEPRSTTPLDAALSQNHPRAQPLTPANVDQMDLDKSMAFYKDRFADASDFTFVFVGSFDLPTMKPLVETYLGGLPSLRRNEMVKDVGMRPPSGVVEKQVKSGIAPRSQVSIVFSGPFQNDEQHRVIAQAMADTLAGNLQRTLREDLGGTYGVSMVPRLSKRPIGEYRFTISFACDPARTDALMKTAFRGDRRIQAEWTRPGAGCRYALHAHSGSRDEQRERPVSLESHPVQVPSSART